MSEVQMASATSAADYIKTAACSRFVRGKCHAGLHCRHAVGLDGVLCSLNCASPQCWLESIGGEVSARMKFSASMRSSQHTIEELRPPPGQTVPSELAMQTLTDVINLNNRQRRGVDMDSRFGSRGPRESGMNRVVWGEDVTARFHPNPHSRRKPQQQFGSSSRSQNFAGFGRPHHQRSFPRTGGASFSQTKYGRFGSAASGVKSQRHQWNQHDVVMRQVLEVQRQIQEQEIQAQFLQQASGILQKLLLQMQQKPDERHSLSSEAKTSSTRCGSVGGRASSGSTCSGGTSGGAVSSPSVIDLVREAAVAQASGSPLSSDSSSVLASLSQSAVSSPWSLPSSDGAKVESRPPSREWILKGGSSPGLSWSSPSSAVSSSDSGGLAFRDEILQRLQKQQREKEVLERIALLQSVEELLSVRQRERAVSGGGTGSGSPSSPFFARSPKKEYSEHKHPELPLDEIVRRRFHERLVKDHAYRNPPQQPQRGAPSYPAVGLKDQGPPPPPGLRRSGADWLDPSLLLSQDSSALYCGGWNCGRSAAPLSPKTATSSLCSPLVFPLESPDVPGGECDTNVGVGAALDADCGEIERLSGVESLLEGWGVPNPGPSAPLSELSSTSLSSLEENAAPNLHSAFKGRDSWLLSGEEQQTESPLISITSPTLSENSFEEPGKEEPHRLVLGVEEPSDKELPSSSAPGSGDVISGSALLQVNSPECASAASNGNLESTGTGTPQSDF